jgi:hypothetical protein
MFRLILFFINRFCKYKIILLLFGFRCESTECGIFENEIKEAILGTKSKNNGSGNGADAGVKRDYSNEIGFLTELEAAFRSAGGAGDSKGKAAGNMHAKSFDYETHAANCANAVIALKEKRYSNASAPIDALIGWLLASKNRDFSMKTSGNGPMFARCIARVLGLIPKRIAASNAA